MSRIHALPLHFSRMALPMMIAASLTLSAGAMAADATTKTPAAPAMQAAAASTNPFAEPSTLQYQAPDFTKIKESDYAPALDEGMRLQRAEIDAIANNPAPPTFENTLVAMERSGAMLTRVAKVFFNLTQSNTDPAMQKVEEDMAPKLSAHMDAIFLDPKLFARVKALYDERASLKLDPESDHLVERYYQRFVHAGAQLSDADKETIKKLNAEDATLSTKFGKNVLADTNAGAIEVDDKAELAGMSDADIAAAAEAAKSHNLPGKWLITLQNTTTQPALASIKDRALREKIYKSSIARDSHGGPNDNTQIVARLAQLRAQKAKLLGYPNFAAYAMEDQMAKTPEAAVKLMSGVVPAAVANAKAEAAKIQAVIDRQHGGFKLQPWDWDFYAEQVRKAEYNLDEAQIRPYFELNRVLNDGVFFAANKLYGLTFKERKDLPVYQPDVRVFEVFDPAGKSMALIYLDYYARDSKHGGAWMDSFVDQSDLLNTRPVVLNVLNISKPAPGQPALLSFDEVTTMFHEFGHALHGMLSKTNYPMFSGTSTPRDFVEFPSQFNENWALNPIVFANYAKNYKTGQPMPADLVAKIKKSSTFNQGYATTEYLEAALLDMAWHQLPADAPLQDTLKFEDEALAKAGVKVDQVPPRYRTTYFQHIWSGGYSAGYYAYMWTDVLAQDAFAWFTEHGGLTRANGQHFEDTVLSRGGTKDAHQLYLDFRGREPSVEPYLEKKGLKAAPAQK
jgi:peptidyl-dipeptidase Dcp